MQDEQMLLRAAQRGDTAAYSQLMAPYERKLYGLCLRMLGNAEDARDCAQDALVRIWRSLGGFREASSFTTWMYRIATNTCLDLLRRQKARPAVSLDSLTDAGFTPADPKADPAAAAESSARREALARGITTLPEELKTALVLREVQGLSYEEVASVLDVPLGTVKSRISRAREKLRESLQHDRELFTLASVQQNERRKDT